MRFPGNAAPPRGLPGEFPGMLDAKPAHFPANSPDAQPSSREIPGEFAGVYFPGDFSASGISREFPGRRLPHPKKVDPWGEAG